MKNYNELAVNHGVYGEYKNACKKQSSGKGTGWRIDIEKAIDSAEKGQDIDAAMRFWCDRPAMPASHIEAGLKHRG